MKASILCAVRNVDTGDFNQTRRNSTLRQ